VACPTLFSELLRVQTSEHHTVLLEYDTRFKIHGERFIYYDYKDPLDLPPSLERESFDLVVADPPFLSEECMSKVAKTIKFLAKDKVMVCTGRQLVLL
jgi:16S rRNA G966 N2-methylase RsmD